MFFYVVYKLHYDNVPNLRGRKGHGRGQESSGSDRDAESDDEFNFASVEEAEGGSAKDSESGQKGSNQRVETNLAEHGGDEPNKGEKAKTMT